MANNLNPFVGASGKVIPLYKKDIGVQKCNSVVEYSPGMHKALSLIRSTVIRKKGRKEERKEGEKEEGMKEGTKEGRKEGTKERRRERGRNEGRKEVKDRLSSFFPTFSSLVILELLQLSFGHRRRSQTAKARKERRWEALETS
jgi:hypothetical protein